MIVFQFPQDPSKDFIKRCIATGGQTLEIQDKQVVARTASALQEPYAIHTDPSDAAGGLRARATTSDR